MTKNELGGLTSCPYASHLEVTVACAIRSGLMWPHSTILELGCGDYSTPTLASITSAQGRHLTVVSSDSSWASRYEYLVGAGFELKLIDRIHWARIEFAGPYGMVLVDNEQTVLERLRLVRRLAAAAKTVVLHDADVVERVGRSWHPIKRLFKYLFVHRQRRPFTAIMSNQVNPRSWFE